MRRVTLLLALAVGFSTYAGAKIEWNKSRHDFGAFNESMGPMTAVFTYYNTGDEPLVITGARANCGCTTPVYSSELLAPGDSATLSVTYDPAGRPGRFEKYVFVDSNTEPTRSQLKIGGVSIASPSTVSGRYPVAVGPLHMGRTASLLGTIAPDKVKSIYEHGYNASSDTLRPIVEDIPKWLSVKTVPEAVPPGEQFFFSYFITGSKIPEWDLYTDTVTIRPFAGSPDFLRMPVIVTVSEDFSKLSDKELANAPIARLNVTRFAPVTITPKGAQVTLTLDNDGNSPLKIRRLYTRTPGVKTDAKADETVKPGKSRTFNITFPGDCVGTGMVSTVVLTLVTNDPLNPKQTIYIPIRSAQQ